MKGWNVICSFAKNKRQENILNYIPLLLLFGVRVYLLAYIFWSVLGVLWLLTKLFSLLEYRCAIFLSEFCLCCNEYFYPQLAGYCTSWSFIHSFIDISLQMLKWQLSHGYKIWVGVISWRWLPVVMFLWSHLSKGFLDVFIHPQVYMSTGDGIQKLPTQHIVVLLGVSDHLRWERSLSSFILKLQFPTVKLDVINTVCLLSCNAAFCYALFWSIA